jgi:hypothetical protein
MLESFKRLLGKSPDDPDMASLEAWTDNRHYTLRRSRDNSAALVEGRFGNQAWRIEWGPSQRNYIAGHELRLIAEMDLTRELQVLLLNRELREAMEQSVYENFVGGIQTRIDTETPPEMRWLVMFGSLEGHELGSLHERYAALASKKGWLMHWLAGPLSAALAVTLRRVPAAHPVVMTIGRGRLTLRTAMAHADAHTMAFWLAIFECAVHEVMRANQDAAGIPASNPYEDIVDEAELGPADDSRRLRF